jgi:hypothetical protein
MLPARTIQHFAAQVCRWVDANGNLWLFGGFGVPASGTEGNMNDLWMYMP